MWLLPKVAEAASLSSVMLKVNQYIINPLILLLFAVALVVFIVGIIEFLSQRDTNADAGEKGKRHMLWGIIGICIMVAVFAIMRIIVNTLGAELPPEAQIPNP